MKNHFEVLPVGSIEEIKVLREFANGVISNRYDILKMDELIANLNKWYSKNSTKEI
jgi:hypothetical protein